MEVARVRGKHERPARPFGAEETLRDTIAAPLPPCERGDYDDRGVTAARRAVRGNLGSSVDAREGDDLRRGQSSTRRATKRLLPRLPPLRRTTPPPPPPSSYPAGLSAREAEVLKLAADGFSNARVAEGILLSASTIDRHFETPPTPGLR